MKISLCLISLLLIGCVDVPMTTIKVPTANGIVTIKAPKDTDIAGLKANFEAGTVSLDSYKARMNPDVISATSAGQLELIRAYGELANSLGQLGMRAFAASQGVSLPPPQIPTVQTNPPPTTITTDQLNALIERRAEQLANARAAQAVTNRPPNALRNPAVPRVRRESTNAPASNRR